jgi:hypothetical protein
MRTPTFLLLFVTLSVQGCGVFVTTYAGYKEKSQFQQQHHDCKGPEGDTSPNCDRRLFTITPPPVLHKSKTVGNAPSNASLELASSIRQTKDIGELSGELGMMAFLANVVYHDFTASADRSKPIACGLRQAGRHPLELEAGDVLSEQLNAIGWQRWSPEDKRDDVCEASGGLFMDTYIRQMDDTNGTGHQTVDVVIAFRGTENSPDQFVLDWSNNFTTLLGLQPSEYVRARNKLKNTIAAIQKLKTGGKTVHVYAVGHSLGGGLAQQAAYLHREIEATFAFNTSPVTNWSRLRLEEDGRFIEQLDPIIFRIEEQGEGLDYVRFISTRFNLRRFGRTDIEFNFTDPSFFKSHSMAGLACNLSKQVASSNNEPKHFGFTKALAKTIGDSCVCVHKPGCLKKNPKLSPEIVNVD